MKLDDLSGYLLGTTHHSMLALVQRRLQEKEVPLTSEQFKVLNLVYLEPGINQKAVAQTLRKDKPGVTRLVEGLERSYLIIRKQDEEDRRNRRLFLTEDGKKVREKIEPIVKEVHDVLYQNISNKEIEQFKEIVRKMRTNINEALNQ
jgi:DNA-binding MarR family transcriptional regulator